MLTNVRQPLHLYQSPPQGYLRIRLLIYVCLEWGNTKQSVAAKGVSTPETRDEDGFHEVHVTLVLEGF